MEKWKQKQGHNGMEQMMTMMSLQHKCQQAERRRYFGDGPYGSWGQVPNLKHGYQKNPQPYPPYGDNPYEEWKGNWKEIVEQRQKQQKEAAKAAKEEARKEREKRISKRRARGINRIRGL